jgi:class 3 adenylate cyclase
MGHAAKLISNSRHAPVSVNTWGDAIYAVFDFAVDAGCFALELVRMMRDLEASWLSSGLYWEETVADGTKKKHPLNIRVGLHTGPVFLHYDPIVRRMCYSGAHVNRAARIEPVSKPGEVYASEEFAALAALEARIQGDDEGGGGTRDSFICEYAGTMPLAKGYPGRYRIYHVQRRPAFDVEVLARTIHQEYCAKQRLRGVTREENVALVPWEDLPEDLRDANRAQAGDVPTKLRMLGYELSPLHGVLPRDVNLDPATLEAASRREHDRWMAERRRQGWVYGPVRDNARKYHPLIVSWEDLTEPEREKDRDAVRNALALADQAGFRLRPL